MRYELMYIPMRGLNLSTWKCGSDSDALKAEFAASLGCELVWVPNGDSLDAYRTSDIERHYMEARLLIKYQDARDVKGLPKFVRWLCDTEDVDADELSLDDLHKHLGAYLEMLRSDRPTPPPPSAP